MRVFELIEKLKKMDEELEVVVMDAWGDEYVSSVEDVLKGKCETWEIPSTKARLCVLSISEDSFNREGTLDVDD